MSLKTIKKVSSLFLIGFYVVGLTACSVVSAAKGSKEPDMSKVVIGSPKEVVEKELGKPLMSNKQEKNEFLYSYIVGDKSSPLRATGYALLDLVSAGYWEYIGTPLEASKSGDARFVKIKYSENNQVLEVKEEG